VTAQGLRTPEGGSTGGATNMRFPNLGAFLLFRRWMNPWKSAQLGGSMVCSVEVYNQKDCCLFRPTSIKMFLDTRRFFVLYKSNPCEITDKAGWNPIYWNWRFEGSTEGYEANSPIWHFAILTERMTNQRQVSVTHQLVPLISKDGKKNKYPSVMCC
jgi:hypothetical protein